MNDSLDRYTFTNIIRKNQHNNTFDKSSNRKQKEKKIKMEMSPKDRLSILAMAIIGMIIFLLIAYDPLNILDTSQKWILGLIVAVANVPLLWYQVNRIKKRTK